MKEEFLHYLWRYGLYDSSKLETSCGKSVQVVFSGQYNLDAGPDFLEAKMYLDNVLWVGHVEIHLTALKEGIQSCRVLGMGSSLLPEGVGGTGQLKLTKLMGISIYLHISAMCSRAQGGVFWPNK